MLVSLSVRNIALIEQLDIQFHQGLHVLTGETGAGKSIVVDSINLVLGERADRSFIRSGCDKASVEAIIDISACPQARQMLAEQSLEADADWLSIQREITMADRNLCRVCGVVVPLSYLRQLSALLVDIHGQHEHQSLLDVKNHIVFLDSFGNDTFHAHKETVALYYRLWKESGIKYSALRKESAQREQRIESIRDQVRELEAAQPIAGEMEALTRERERFVYAEKINSAVELAYHAVFSGGGHQQGAALLLKSASDAMRSIAGFDPRYSLIAERLASAYYEAEELGIELRDSLATISFDPERNEWVQERVDLLKRLERRYGMTADELAGHCEELKAEHQRFSSLDERLKRAETDYKSRLSAYRHEAAKLTEMRKALAVHFQGIMETQLGELGMSQTHFECVFEMRPDETKPAMPTESGEDRIEFFIAPNLGEPLKPLYKTASGGELSRLMLALKTAGASQNMVPCMVFDEIDTGISGNIANTVAEKMAQIAQYRQVICVTHLAQIACMADTEYLVEKHVAGERTITSVKELSQEEREMEIARLVGAQDQHKDSGLHYARNLLASAREYKRKQAYGRS